MVSPLETSVDNFIHWNILWLFSYINSLTCMETSEIWTLNSFQHFEGVDIKVEISCFFWDKREIIINQQIWSVMHCLQPLHFLCLCPFYVLLKLLGHKHDKKMSSKLHDISHVLHLLCCDKQSFVLSFYNQAF